MSSHQVHGHEEKVAATKQGMPHIEMWYIKVSSESITAITQNTHPVFYKHGVNIVQNLCTNSWFGRVGIVRIELVDKADSYYYKVRVTFGGSDIIGSEFLYRSIENPELSDRFGTVVRCLDKLVYDKYKTMGYSVRNWKLSNDGVQS